MPMIVESPFELRFATAEGRAESDRPKGLHCTDVIASLDKSLHPGKYGTGMDEKVMRAYAEGGWIWETIMTRAFAERSINVDRAHAEVVPQVPLVKDGIHMTPDAVLFRKTNVAPVLAEFKATWRSAKKADDLESYFWTWLIQMACYAHALGLLKGELYAFFVNGRYEGGHPSQPCARMWELTWTTEELARVWGMVTTHAVERMGHRL
jgi:hypothetical protein